LKRITSTSKLRLYIQTICLLIEVASVFLVFFELGSELANVLYSAGLYGSVLTLSEFLFFIFATLYSQILLYNIKKPDKVTAKSSETSSAYIAIVDFIILYGVCLAIYLLTIMPLSIVCIKLNNNYLEDLIISILLAIFMPLLPCSVSSFMTHSFNKHKCLRAILSFFCSFTKISLYIFAIYVFVSSNYYWLGTLIAKTSLSIQIIYFPSGYVVRALFGNAIEALILAIICIATAAIPLTVAFKKKR